MTYKSPSGVFNYTQVPDDAGDADVKIFVNGEEVSAGGGSSDFTVAKISVTNQHSDAIQLNIANADDDENTSSDQINISGGSTVDNINVILYKGNAYGTLFDSNGQLIEEDVTVSGDVEFDEGDVTVTGDGTITYNPGGAN